MRIQTGNPVRGDDFFVRENLIEQTWEHLESGSHILIAAPRRVGKTSLMRYLEDCPRPPFGFLYLITESVNNENEFYRRILNRIVKTAFVKKSQKILSFLEQRKPAIKKIGVDGIEFGAREEHDYFEMLLKILQAPYPEANKLVIMVDEFPETLENIIEDEGEATHIDIALQAMLEQRNHFEHWHTRLRTTFKGKEYRFVKDVINIASEKGEVTSNEVFDLAVKYKIENSFKDIIGSLAYDGYINNHDEVHRYRFNSPILKMWWRQNVAN